MKSLLDQIKILGGPNKESLDLIAQVIDSEPESLLAYPEIFNYLITSQNDKLLNKIDFLSNSIPELKELRSLSSIEIPQSIKVSYNPTLDSFVVNDEKLGFIKVDISDSKKKLFLSLASDDKYLFEIQCHLNQKEGLFRYTCSDSQNQESSLKRFLSNHALSVALAGTVVFGAKIGYMGMEKVYDKTHNHSISSNDELYKKFSTAIIELEKIKDQPQLFEALNELKDTELEYASQLTSDTDMTESQEKYKSVITDQIKGLITSAQNERIKYKTIKRTLSEDEISKIAQSIVEVSIDQNLDYRIFTSIIMQESKFDQGVVSSSGDVAIAQINYEIWKPEFDNLKLDLDKKKLKQDEHYAIETMGIILSVIKDRHGDNDPYWYARYHSSTKSRKFEYANLVNSYFYSFNKFQIQEIDNKITRILEQLKIINFDKYNDVNSFEVRKLTNSLLQIKIKLKSADIPSQIASN